VRVDRQGDLSPQQFLQDTRQNPVNRALLERLPALGLPDAWLVAGCLFQTVWNLQAGRSAAADIKDYDLFYFDAADLSEQAEAAVGERVSRSVTDLGVQVETKNQARVHTWYPQWFGHPYPALTSARDGIDRFLVPCTCVGLSLDTPRGDAPALYAPNGLADLYAGILRPNPLCDHRALFRDKAASYQRRWPWLRIDEGPLSVAAG
jgi:hypothetical protein